MQQHDINNLKFLLSRSTIQLHSWYENATYAELVYANKLLDRYAEILEDEIQVGKIERKLDTMPVFVEAQAVIAAVRE
jgi:hypothetical protein